MPPAVQAPLAVRAAAAGRALLLEKPLGADLAAARSVAEAVAEHGVPSQLVLTKRYHPAPQAFLGLAAAHDTSGARSCYLHGAFLDGDQATAWRLEHGALLGLGPHLLDLLDEAVSPIVQVRATGDPCRWTELTCEHENGAVRLPRARTRVELFGEQGELVYDTAGIDHEECWPVLRAAFATAVRTGTTTAPDAARGLRLQCLLDQAMRSLGN